MSTRRQKRIAGYVRVSRKGKRDNFQSPEEQRAAIEALAEERGFEVARWVEEIDRPAGGADRRPEWERLRDAVGRGELDGVAVYDFSRWSRDTEKGLASIREMRAEVDEAQFALDEARADLDGFRKDTKLRRTMGDLYAETMGDYIVAVNVAEAELAKAKEQSSGRGRHLRGRAERGSSVG